MVHGVSSDPQGSPLPCRVVAVYARISDDKADDAQGVARQIQDGTALAERSGFAVHAYIDNDVSAFKRHIVRPQFEAMLRDLDSGALAGIVAYDLDRLWRQPIDLERAIEIYERRPGLWFATLQGDINLSTSDGRMLARVMVAAANKSSADTARRVARKHADNQLNGKPAGGPRPFGFLPDRINHDPREADAVRWAVKHLLEGGAISEIVRRLNTDGVKTTQGNQWRPSSVRATLRNPRLKGMRARWTGKVWEPVLDASGTPVKATWEGIVTHEEFDALQAILDERTRMFAGGRRGVTKYLLTGVARCGKCGAGMRGYNNHNGTSLSYCCMPPSMGGCGGVSRVMRLVDPLVTEAVLTLAESHTAGGESRVETVSRDADLTRIDRLLGDALREWKGGALPSSDYFQLRRELTDERKALEAEQVASVAAAERQRAAKDARSEWERASVAKRRAILDGMVEAVVIHPLPIVDGRKVRKWNPELIEIVWKDA